MPNALNKMLKDQLSKKLGKIDNVVAVDFQGLNSEKMAIFRAELRKANLQMEVVKNAIAVHALKDLGLKPMIEHDTKLEKKQRMFKGPTGLIFGGDGAVDVAKFTKKWNAEHKNSLKVKGGQMGHDVLDIGQVEASASLPGRKELLSTLAGDFLAMPQKVAAVFQAGYAQVAYAFNALGDKLEKAAPPQA
jgi:ribosomal protein L10